MENDFTADKTLEGKKFDELLKTDPGVRSEFDRRITQAIKTREENLKSKIAGEVLSTADQDLKQERDALMKKENSIAMRERALKYAVERGVDLSVADRLASRAESWDEVETDINAIFGNISKAYQGGRDSFVKENNYVPPGADMDAIPFGGDQKRFAEAIRQGRAPSSGPLFAEIMAKMKGGRR